MAEIDELALPWRLFLRAYPWRRVDPVPWTPLAKPLARSRLALVSSAGFHLPDQPPFDGARRGGDPSFREIPWNAEAHSLVESHRSEAFDHAGLQRDPNLGLPLDRARELVARRRIGSLAERHLSFMGSITAPGRLMRDSAPAAAETLERQAVDIALLVPV